MNWRTHAFAAFIAVCLLGSLTGCASTNNPPHFAWDKCKPLGDRAYKTPAGKPAFRYDCGSRIVWVTGR